MLNATPNPAMGQADSADKQRQTVKNQLPDTTTWEGMRDFLEGLFDGPGFNVWTTGFQSVSTGESWHGQRGLTHLERRFPDMDADLYFCIGELDSGATRRSNTGIVGQPLLIVDDIGTKIDVAKWDALFAAGCPRPSAQIETSPGNQTWIWALAGDSRDPQRFLDLALLRAWLVELKLTDEVMDVARYVRLPGGWNSKPKYRGPNGTDVPPPVSLVGWNLGSDGRVELNEIGAAVLQSAGQAVDWTTWADADFPQTASGRALMSSAQLGAGGGAGVEFVRSADLGAPDAVMRLGIELGMNLHQVRAGVVEALCPNIAAHTTRADTGFAFLGEGVMACSHASCQGHSTVDFRSMMAEQYDVQTGRAGAGREFLAREGARDAGMLSDAPEALAVAGRMAAAAAANAQTAKAGGREKGVHIRAIDLMDAHNMAPFLDPDGVGVWLWVDGRLCNLKTLTGVRPLWGWLALHNLDVTGAARNHLVETLEARACAKPERRVAYRVANLGPPELPEICLNLMDAQNRGVHITASGWCVKPLAEMPLPLARRAGGSPLPLPEKAYDGLSLIDRLGKHIPLANIARPDDPNDQGVQQRAAILAFLVAQFVRVGAVMHLSLSGEQGSGKTTTARRLNSLTDPDIAAVLPSLGKTDSDIFAQVSQSSNVILDNSSGVRSEQADILCVLATGGAFAGRKLYTNGERATSSALCSVIFTTVLEGGITRRGDLQDRMLSLSTSPLAKTQRRSESELDAAWDTDLPYLLADILDLLAIGLAHVATVRGGQKIGVISSPPRFADVAQIAEAAAWFGLKWPAGVFTRALDALRGDAAEAHLSTDPIAFRMRALLLQQTGRVWRGTYEELEVALSYLQGPSWDRNRMALKGGLGRVRGQLRDLWGISGEQVMRRANERIYEWRMETDFSSLVSAGSP